MKTSFRFLMLFVLATALAAAAFAQGNRTGFANYGEGSLPLTGTPGTQNGAAAGYWNPAAWAAMQEWEMSFLWNDVNVQKNKLDNWGLFLGGSGFGFSTVRHTYGNFNDSTFAHVQDYQLALGGGTRDHYWGLAFDWQSGDRGLLKRDQSLTLGDIYRPCRYASFGGAVGWGIKRGNYRGIADLGIRPLGTHRLTLFGDLAFDRHDTPKEMQWGAGLEIQPIDGIRVAAKMSKLDALSQDKLFSVSLGLSLDGIGFHVVPAYDKKSKRQYTSYLLRLGEQEPSFNTERFSKKKQRVVSMNMRGSMTYQTALWFDNNRMALRDMLNTIEDAKKDPSVGGIALNMSEFEPSRELCWELRGKLQDFRTAGKKVYVYVDRAGMTDYYLASVADYIWMDPSGTLMLQGYAAGRTYMKNFLNKIGLGVEEWRYFTYKSAFEAFARSDMSNKDKEQRLALISDFWDEWEKEVSASRKLTPEALRAVRDTLVIFNPEEAVKAGLVDTLGTWDDAKDFIKKIGGEEPTMVKKEAVGKDPFADPTWGKRPQIALVYAIGECDMESGIRGRTTSRLLRKLAEDKDVKAVVLRADSPGGDALPSDLVAREMSEIAKKKPMVVSQGDVAASGGYWISMNGTRIFSSPMTITGSIGVIGGFVWNDKFSEKTGFTYDHVQVGDHADLGLGATLPLIGAMIPDRPLSDIEHRRVERLIRGWYAEFTQKVAKGRSLQQTYVDSIGQGRVWAGRRALQLKLVDDIGRLDQAILYARDQAKIPEHRKYDVVEYPRRPWFSPDLFSSRSPMAMLSRILVPEPPVQQTQRQDYELHILQKMASRHGEPFFMLPPEDMPIEDRPQ